MKYEFRGIAIETGEYVYGGINDDGTAIVSGYTFIPVKPESVAQRVGLDEKGAKVYERDKMKLGKGKFPEYEYEAYLKPLAEEKKHGCITYPHSLVLKGAASDDAT